jgi:competence protein ComEC
MTTGDRSGITPEIRRAYSRTGAAHLLAVSGLHVGIVFLIINVLLYLLPLMRGGHIAKNMVAIAGVWLYAALTGLSPSAVRAACMFSGAQVALAVSRSHSGVNIMCGTAFVMLAVKPGLLFDISFQLSFIAVAAIMSWFGPLYRLLESRWRGLNALWATLIVGLTASVATLPLVSHTFGVFSPAGIVLNPIVIATAHIVVVCSLVWIIAPVPFLEPVFRWLVGAPAWLQNRVVGAVSDVPGAAVEWTMPLWLVFVIYSAMIIFTAAFHLRAATTAAKQKKPEPFIIE